MGGVNLVKMVSKVSTLVLHTSIQTQTHNLLAIDGFILAMSSQMEKRFFYSPEIGVLL